MSKAVLFVNFSDQPFSSSAYIWPVGSENEVVDEHCKWNGVGDSFAPHASRYMEDWRAEHYAKHLINRELDKINKPINDAKLRAEMLKKCVIDKGEEVNTGNIEMELMNKNIKPSEPAIEAPTLAPLVKKKGRPAKTKVAEPEFADLKNA